MLIYHLMTQRTKHSRKLLNILMYFSPGLEHRRLHEWWHLPMDELASYWVLFEARTMEILDGLRDAAEGLHLAKNKKGLSLVDKSDPEYTQARKDRKKTAKRASRALLIESSMYDAMEECLRDRARRREGWQSREHEISLLDIPKNCKPMVLSIFTESFPSPLECDRLDSYADNIAGWKQKFDRLPVPNAAAPGDTGNSMYKTGSIYDSLQ